MRRIAAATLIWMVGAFAGAQAQDTADDAAIKKQVDAFTAAWNSHDAKAMAGLWAEDGDLVNPFGRTAKGRAETEKLFQDEHTGVMKESTYAPGTVTARLINADTAVVDFDGSVTGMKAPDGSAPPPFQHHVTLIMGKKDGQWWILAARAMAFLPAPGMAASPTH